MTTVIVYDHFIALGGAENVSLQLANALHDASIETAYADEKLFSEQLAQGRLHSSAVKELQGPLNSAKLLLFYLLRYKLPSCESAVFSGLFSPLALLRKTRLNKTVIYFHMFPTFLNWSTEHLQEHYGKVGACMFSVFISLYKTLLKRSVVKADSVFCNSEVTQSQFKLIGIDADVLYPPVDVSMLEYKGNDGYYLSTARLEESKRVQIIAETFSTMPSCKVKFVGEGTLFESLTHKYRKFQNIEFVGWCSPEHIHHYYNSCKALVYLPKNEAFGIAPIEALAAGKRVIGVKEGGLIETISSERYGVLLPGPITVELLKAEILNVEKLNDSKDDIAHRIQYAKAFEASKFINTMKSALDINNE